MKKLFLLVAVIGLVSMNSFAQKPNFAGTYNLNESKSKLGEGPMARGAYQITVAQEANLLSVERKSKGRDGGEDRIQTAKYTLDGKVSENPSFMNNVSKSTATWSADQKSLTIVTTMTFGEGQEMKSSEVWTLGADGSINIESTRPSRDGGEMKTTLVYDKAK
jgi:hypothetical protein